VHMARLPTAPIAIFRKKLESGLSASLGILVEVRDSILLGRAAAAVKTSRRRFNQIP